MIDAMRNARDSIALDAAYLMRGVPAAIESLAEQTLLEVENVRNDNGNPGDGGVGPEGSSPVVSRETGGTPNTGDVDGAEP